MYSSIPFWNSNTVLLGGRFGLPEYWKSLQSHWTLLRAPDQSEVNWNDQFACRCAGFLVYVVSACCGLPNQRRRASIKRTDIGAVAGRVRYIRTYQNPSKKVRFAVRNNKLATSYNIIWDRSWRGNNNIYIYIYIYIEKNSKNRKWFIYSYYHIWNPWLLTEFTIRVGRTLSVILWVDIFSEVNLLLLSYQVPSNARNPGTSR